MICIVKYSFSEVTIIFIVVFSDEYLTALLIRLERITSRIVSSQTKIISSILSWYCMLCPSFSNILALYTTSFSILLKGKHSILYLVFPCSSCSTERKSFSILFKYLTLSSISFKCLLRLSCWWVWVYFPAKMDEVRIPDRGVLNS